MLRFLLLIILAIPIISLYADEIVGKVVCAESNEAVAYATITAEYTDTIEGFATNNEGEFAFTPRQFPVKIKAHCFGMDDAEMTVSEPTDNLVISLNTNSIQLQEVAVVGQLTTQTDNGISYNMAANKRAQSENILQSLAYVPLINVDVDGTISVQGSQSYSLYVNGRPNEMAQTAPKAYLESLPASSIAKVEVITRPDNKYSADANSYIINIVLKSPMVEGYIVNVSGGGNTQPAADGSLLGMIKKGNVDASLNYDYNLNGQRHQPMDVTYTSLNSAGEATEVSKINDVGNGNWHTHTMRAMVKWQIDSLNTLYADAHGRINQTNLTEDLSQSELWPNVGNNTTYLSNLNKYTAGTAEANLIYRNYFGNDQQSERWLAGYHFTYNPDKRSLTQSRRDDGGTYPDYFQRTYGGMTEHTAKASYLLKFSPWQSLRITANEMYRHGSTNSSYFYDDEAATPQDNMTYNNSITALTISYSSWIKRKIYIRLLARGNYDYLTMALPQDPSLNYTRNRFYFLPSAYAYWRPNQDNTLMLQYSTSLTRPSIDQLNPFASTTNDLSVSVGNPDLKAQYSNNVSLMWYFTKVKNLTLATTLQYEHLSDVILPYNYTNGERKVSTFSNFGGANQYSLMFNVNWRPASWASFSLNGNIGERSLTSTNINLKQNDFFCYFTPQLNFFLPNHFRIGGKYGYYKSTPSPMSSRSAIQNYSCYISKSFLDGRLNLSVTANSPFNKYIHSKEITTMPSLITTQNNYITARSFGISLSYSFSGGKKVNLDRDNTMGSTDQSTGVQ